MTDAKAKIATILRADSVMQSYLPVNKPYSGKGTASKDYSVIPAGLAQGDTISPFITIQQGTSNRVGEFLWNELYYIRCYDDETNGTVRIQKIMARVKYLLDRHQFTDLDSGRGVSFRFEGGLPETRDDPMQKHFCEDQYRLLAL